MLINPEESLSSAEDKIWNELVSASKNPEHPFRFTVLSTVDGQQPVNRYLVVREVIPWSSIILYTDFRSSKVRQLKANPRCSLLFYDGQQRIQLTFHGIIHVHFRDSLANEHWKTVSEANKKAYTSIYKPGKQIERPGEAHDYAEMDHFCVLEFYPGTLDALQLDGQEHIRARFTKDKDNWQKAWVAP